MKKKRLYLIPALFIISLSAFALSACNHPQSPQEKADWIVHKITTEFELRDDQIVKLEDIKHEIMEHHKVHKAKKAIKMEKFLAEIQKPSIDPVFFTNSISDFTTAIEQASPSLIEKIVIFHASLTAEQKQKMVEMIKKHHHNHAS